MTNPARIPQGVLKNCPVCNLRNERDPFAPNGEGPCSKCGTELWFAGACAGRVIALPHLKVAVIQFGQNAVLDEENLELFRLVLHELVNVVRHKHVLINLENLDSVTTHGIGMILSLMRRLKEREGRLVLCSCPADLREVFRITRLDHLLDLCENAETAMTHF